MSFTPSPGPRGSPDKSKPDSATSEDQRVSALTETRSGKSSSQDDQQAARARLPRPIPFTGNATPGRAAGALSNNKNTLSYGLNALSRDLPLIPMLHLPPWARRMPRIDAVTGLRIPARAQQPLPPHANPPLTGLATASQPSHPGPPPRHAEDEAIIWFMAPSPSKSPGHHLPTLCRFAIPQDTGISAAESDQRYKEVSHMAGRAFQIRARGGPSHPATRSDDPMDRKLKEWMLAAERLHETMPNPRADTVWVSRRLLVREDWLYRAWVRLFVNIFWLEAPYSLGL